MTSFKCLGAVVSDDGSKPGVLSRIAQATAALRKLKPIWRDNNISLGSKVKLMRSLVISTFLFACESWTLTGELEKRMQAFAMRCYRRLLNISYKDHITNEEVHRKVQAAIGEYDELLTLVKKQKLRWFGHVSRSFRLAKTILQGTVKGKRKRDRQKKMTNRANGIQREVKGQKLGTVTSFKYLGAVVSDDGSKPEVLSKIAQATASLTKLKPIWRDNNIALGSKVKRMRSLVVSIFLYACESWTLTAELEKRTQAFEMRCYRRVLKISYKDHVTNEEVRRNIQAAIGEYDELLTLVKKRKLR